MRPPSRYLHGTSRGEQRRLALMNDLVNRRSLAALRLQGGERILEMGSGLGQFARAMARAARPGGRVLGIERSPEQIGAAQRLARATGEGGLIEVRRGDVLDPPLRREEWGTFDVVHARFILEHLPDPLAAVRVMVRAARPGGRIVLEDDDHDVLRLWPEPPGFAPLWRAYIRTFDRLGNDPFVGRRLVTLLRDAGARPRRNRWLFFGSCPGDPMFRGYVDNVRALLQATRGTIVEAGLLPAETCDAAIAALGAWGARRDAGFWYAICWAEGTRPDPAVRFARRPRAATRSRRRAA